MSQNERNKLKFSVRAFNEHSFLTETMPKLVKLGFEVFGEDNEVTLQYKDEEIPFEVANHAKVLMEKHAPEYPMNKIERYEEIVDKAHEESEQDLKQEEIENSLEHEAEHTEE